MSSPIQILRETKNTLQARLQDTQRELVECERKQSMLNARMTRLEQEITETEAAISKLQE